MKKNIYLLAFLLSVALVAQTWAGSNRDDKKIIWLKSNYPPTILRRDLTQIRELRIALNSSSGKNLSIMSMTVWLQTGEESYMR